MCSHVGAQLLNSVYTKCDKKKNQTDVIKIIIQSNFDTMPPFGTERKWHSSEGDIVTRICKNSLVM